MTAQPARYRRRGRPDLTVLAWQVTEDNRDAVARWCHGRVEYRLTEPRHVQVRPNRSTTAARDGDYMVEVAEGDWWYPVMRLWFEVFYEPD